MPLPAGNHPIRRSIATVCLSGTLEDKLAATALAGFDGVEIFENDLIGSPTSPAGIRAEANRLGLSIDLYQPFRDAEGAPRDRWATVLRRARHKFGLMSDLGTEVILVCSSVAPDTIDDDDLAAQQLSELADLAEQRGLRIAYEALAWGRHVSSWEHSWRIVSLAGHPALGLCLDSFHILSRSPRPPLLDEVPGNKIFFVQLADAPALDMDVLQWSRHHRVFPGQGAFDLTRFTDAVLRTGYDGPLSLEVFNDLFRQADPYRAAVDGMRSLIALEDRLAQHAVAAGRPGRRHAAPPAPALGGHAFTEFSVDGVSGAALADALRAMGFAHTGQHRTKPVQLWEQGQARIVLNAAVVRVEEAVGEACVNAIAVASDDPAASAARATAMLAAAVPHRRGPIEAELRAVRSPDGTEVIFCPAGTAAEWTGDFLDTGEPRGGMAAGITGTDHVALTQPFDHFDESGLFYRTVLGLGRAEPGEFAAPFGLIRTLAETDQSGGVRIALSAVLLRRGDWAPGVPEPQHVAFASCNIMETAARLRANGAPMLPIMPNYYEDLAARTGMDERRITTLEEFGILHDADATGEFLHLYTTILGTRVFLEVVQRIGGYTGYGAANAPVRMAAHRNERLMSSARNVTRQN
ncbi:MAG TPA: TIM barrel protein [Streptosporangiaceae bacterium]|jgi:4-hydroxyphenylpyruvate dioxygenase